MKIGILITGHPPQELAGNGQYNQYFERLLGHEVFTYHAWSVVDGEMPASVTEADGWLITGSRHGAYENHPWIPPLEDFIRACYAAALPLIGICFGHQIIAQAMGGKVEKFGGGWSVGRTEYDINGQTYAINAWHQDQVTQKPDLAQVIGRTDFCENAALVYGDRILTLQPHPEYGADFMQGLITYRGKGLVPEPLMAQATADLAAPLDSMKIAQQMTDFFTKERA